MYAPNTAETFTLKMLGKFFFFIVCEIILSFGFIKALDSKGILNARKKGITSLMERTDLAAFTFAT